MYNFYLVLSNCKQLENWYSSELAWRRKPDNFMVAKGRRWLKVG